MSNALFEKHKPLLEKAIFASHTREHWSAYPEAPSKRIYGETAPTDGEAAFKARLNDSFDLIQESSEATLGSETSPFGFNLGIRYPKPDLDSLIDTMSAALPAWRKAGLEMRTGICLEILDRLNKASFEIAHAVQHTTGQGFVMAFQAGGPHAQDRGLEAVAYGYLAQKDIPDSAVWEKPVAKDVTAKLEKRWHIAGRGISLMIGCSTFPTWNGYPGLFASLVTGNAVLVKPHPGAILPLAITVRICQQVLQENGMDPHLVALAVDDPSAPITMDLARRAEVKIIDFTGSSKFGDWLEENAKQAKVYTEKAGVNFVLLDSTDDPKGLFRNLALSLSLYSGQMCTTPQNIYVPKDGIRAGDEHLTFEEVGQRLKIAVDKLLSDPVRATEILGAVQSLATDARTADCHSLGKVIRESDKIDHPQFDGARVRTPLILAVDATEEKILTREWFGPIALLVACDDTDHALSLAKRVTREKGAITAAVHSTDPAVLDAAEDACIEAGVAVSLNLTGAILVNQSAAFSDFHATGANPAANASLTDLAFVADRFRVIQSRRDAV